MAWAAGQGARAETWLRRAVAVSRRERDHAAYAAALVELGALYEGRGRDDRAKGYYQRAIRAGRRYAARGARMRAAHGMFRLVRRRGDDNGAAEFALTAQRLWEPGAAGGPDLLLDLARYWMDHGQPTRTQAALRRLGPSLHGLPRTSLLAALALGARARAERGGAAEGAGMARAAWPLMEDAEIADDVRFAAALDLAHATRRAGDLVQFTRAKRAVLRFAPQAEFPAVATEMARMWPEGGSPAMERAS